VSDHKHTVTFIMTWSTDIHIESQDNQAMDFLVPLLSNVSTWSSLHHFASSPFAGGESFGFQQPSVRKSAWLLLQTMLKGHKGLYHRTVGTRFDSSCQLS